MFSGKDQSDFLKANAASLRALAGGIDAQVRYAGQDTHIGRTEIRLPAPPRESRGQDRADSRGASDSAGLWLAVIMTPAWQRMSTVRKAIAGVGIGPTWITSTPIDAMPDASASSNM